MPALAEIQTRVRQAVIELDAAAVEPLLAGGDRGRMRFEIHRRHYEVSLANALTQKFPGCVWLVGTDFVYEAARQYVHQHPPQAPCIAEYGEGFPAFLSELPGADRVPYLRDFAEMEWHVGHAAIAVGEPGFRPEGLSSVDAQLLPDLCLRLQTGVSYLEVGWPVDQLLELYLSGTVPERLEFEPAAVFLEIRGARGEFSVTRLDRGDFSFRKSIWEGRSIGDAAECALDADANFDPASGLAGILAGGLVAALDTAPGVNPNGHLGP